MKSLVKIFAIVLLWGLANLSYAQLGKLKDKADKAASSIGAKKDKVEKTTNATSEQANKSKEEQQLAYGREAQKLLDEKKYKEAAELFQKAHDACPQDCYSGKTEYYLKKKEEALAIVKRTEGTVAIPNVSKPTVEFAADYSFQNKKTDFQPGDAIFVRLITPKPMGEMFKEAFKMQDIPLSGAMAIAVGKSANDENPIVVTQYPFFPNRYKDDKQFAITLQLDQEELNNLSEELENKLPFNSVQTMSMQHTKQIWDQAALKFTPQKYQWTIFFFYQKADSDEIAEAGSGVFTYNVTNENKQKLTAGLNEVDREKYKVIPDDGVKTDFHKNNIGKLVFGKQAVSMDGAGATNSFANLSGGIYARAFLPQSIRNLSAANGRAKDFPQNYLINITAGGKEYNIYHRGVKMTLPEAEKATTLVLNIAPSSEKDNDAIAKAFMYIFSTLPAGKQKISMKVWVQHNYTDADTYVLKSDVKVQEYAHLVGEGTFEVNINPADRDAVVKKYGDKFEGNINTYQDKALAALVKQQYPAIAHKIWGEEIVRNAFGQVIYRTVMVDCAKKNAKGEHIVNRTEVKQQFIGNKWDNRLTGVLVPFGYHVPASNIKP